MIDFARRIHRHCGDVLAPGETVEAATLVQPAGSVARQVGLAIGGGVGTGARGRTVRRRSTADGATAADGFAGSIPQEPLVLGLSVVRMMFFGHAKMTGKPTGLAVSLPLVHVADVAAAERRLSYALVIRFADDSAADFDVVRTAAPAALVAAFRRLKR